MSLLLCALVLALGYRQLTLGGGLLVGGDVAQMHVPVRGFVQDEVAAGRGVPFWYPGDGLGVPLIGAAVPALLHPPTYLGWPLGAARAYWLASLLMVGLAFFGLRALARELGASESGSALAAAAFSLGGPFISNLQNYQFFSGLACTPLLLWGLLCFARDRRAGGALGAAAATFGMITAGSFQAAYIGWGLGLLLVLCASRPGEVRSAGVRSLALLALSTAGAAVQLIPSAITFRHAGRLGGLPWEMASRWSLHPRALGDLLLGDLLHFEPAHQPGLAPLYDLAERTPWIAVAYVGIGIALLAGLGLASSTLPGKVRIGLGVAALLLLLAALGKHTPLYGALHSALPLWGGFRYPAKLLPFAALLFALLSAFGFDRLREGPSRRALLFLGAGVLALLVSGGALLLSFSPEGLAVPLSERWLGRLGLALLRAGGVLAAGGGLLFLARRHPRFGRAGAMALVLIELSLVSQHGVWLYAGPQPPAGSRTSFAPAVHEAHRRRAENPEAIAPRVFTSLELQKGLPVKGYPLNTLTLTTFERLALKPDFAAEQGLETVTPYLPGTDARITDLLLSVPRAEAVRRAAAFGARFLVTDPQSLAGLGIAPDRARAYSQKAELGLVELPEAWVLPRLRLSIARAAREDLSDVAALRRALDAPEVQRGEVVLLETASTLAPSPTETKDPRTLRVLRWEPETLEVALEGEAPAALGERLLVLSEGWAPGWAATVDGEPTELLRANGVLRAVRVAPGDHRVRLVYAVPGLLAGALISAAAWLGLLVWFLRSRFAERIE